MFKNLNFLTAIFALFVFTACGEKKSTETKTQTSTQVEKEAVSEAGENEVSLTEEQMKSIGITLGTIEQKQLTAALKTNGILRVPNQNKATVNSLYSGVVKSLQAQPGMIVRKGQVLATVANPQFIQIQSDYLNVKSKMALTELEIKRQRELNAGNAGALKNLQAAETEMRTLQTAKSTYEQQIRLMGVNPSTLRNGRLVSVLSIRSPINGIVSEVRVQMGSYIDISTVVAEIVDNSQLHLDLFIFEKDMQQLKNNQTIHFTVTNNPGKEYDAEIFSLGSSFEEGTKAVSVHAKVKGDKTGLIDGMNVTAIISLNNATVPAVPLEALVNMAGQDYIFVLKKEVEEEVGADHPKKEPSHGKEFIFERIPVVKGTTDVGFAEVTLLKEIPSNSKIVTKGAFFVQAKMTNTGEHEH